ncbi:glycosyltransferase family 4 protein, partial [Candidatus Peregrinibacteria bacterium]|nr:glycosyltransferase family 4 protein [Candidatus Peregrinibacteria bacterium]
KIIKKEQPDILHIHIWNPASCRYALAIKKIPIITTEHDPFKLSIFKTLIKNNLLKNVRKIIAISQHNKKILEGLYPRHKDKITVIHNGIDTTWWQSQLLRFDENEKIKIKEEVFLAKENTLIVATIAELHERKGQKYLLQAIPETVKKFPNVKFVFIGEGHDRQNLEKLARKLNIENHTIFLGRQKKIPNLLKASDIFCLPSRREAFGLVNLEAMITGLPVVATKTGGIPEIIENNKTGLLVEPENSEALTSALLQLIGDQKLREQFATAGEKTVLENFDAEQMAQKYEKVYESMK